MIKYYLNDNKNILFKYITLSLQIYLAVLHHMNNVLVQISGSGRAQEETHFDNAMK